MSPHGARTRLLPAALVLAALAVSPGSAAAVGKAYVADLETEKVSQYTVALNGALTPLLPETLFAGKGPFAIAISPDARSVYVTDTGAETVAQFDVGPGGALSPKSPATVHVPGGNDADGIAISPDGRDAYVASDFGGVSEFDVGPGGALTPKPVPTISAGANPTGVAVSPDGNSVYVANFGSGNVSEFDVGAGGELSAKSSPSIAAGSSPSSIAITPDGKSVYVSDVNGYEVSQYDVGPGGALAPKSPPKVMSGHFSQGIAVSPDGRYVYVATEATDVVEQFAVASDGTLSLVEEWPTAKEGPVGIAMSPDGGSLYTTVYYGSLIDQYDVAADGKLTPKSPATVATEEHPWGIAVLPDQGPSAGFSASAAPARSASAFDASSSGGAYPIARYDWSFGDGTSSSNAGAKPTHAYSTPGTYTVSVHVTDTAGCSGPEVFTGQATYCNLDPAASASAQVTVPPAPAGAPPKPVVSGARQSSSRWRKGNGLARISRAGKVPVGTTFTFSLNEQAAVRFTFTTRLPGRRVGRKCVAQTRSNRHRKACTRTVGAGVLPFTGHLGSNSVRFQGRVSSSRRLRPGTYTLTITATNTAGVKSAPVALRFTIVR